MFFYLSEIIVEMSVPNLLVLVQPRNKMTMLSVYGNMLQRYFVHRTVVDSNDRCRQRRLDRN